MPLTLTVSMTRSTVYDVDQDFDIEVDRIDHIKQEEVMAYVPVGSPFREAVISALMDLSKALNDRSLVDDAGNTPATP